MYQFSYAEIVEDTFSDTRAREREAVEQAIALLRRAQDAGATSRETVEALHFTRQLWAILIEDLASAENDLPQKLRADLISIGLWVMREAEAIRMGQTDDFSAIIEVNQTIAEGLR
ncbi:flagellar biosynthesis regulator FlaF [Salinarimonas rosea]|uniref:flagellar biosynthesis regulator FlaF n=1 Tax=Salinarimonas rosea TaxID=552063 RepID=UPI000400F8AA|nr:flagellar biosynthesis regulator FlaF [Salinarimonas rosea]